ncbi:neural cell adhesion molecule 1-like isoform X2 [Liolophura sinensis]|uniref:neural cell adhesion molecule 1-like isoform X2 n=1 Tax=Liolophura sinensis TaxID=3198878 RepID=UPI00315905A1
MSDEHTKMSKLLPLFLSLIACHAHGLRISSSVTVELGSQTTVTCTGDVTESGLQLISPSGQIYRPTQPSSNQIQTVIVSVDDRDIGEWTCRAANSQNAIVSAVSRIVLQHRIMARVTHKGPVSIGGQAVFRCEIRGNPMPTPSWRKGFTSLSDQEGMIKIQNDVRPYATFSVLTLSNVQASDAGSYVCSASTGRTRASGSAYLFVRAPSGIVLNKRTTQMPTVRPTEPQQSGPRDRLSASLAFTGPASVGQRLQLDCRVSAPSGATVTWYKDYRRISSPGVQLSSETRIDGQHQLLTIASVQLSDAGRYRCEVSKDGSAARSSVQVNVNGAGGAVAMRPSFGERLSVRLSTTGFPRAGSSFRLDCRVTAPPGSTVTWWKDNFLLNEYELRQTEID